MWRYVVNVKPIAEKIRVEMCISHVEGKMKVRIFLNIFKFIRFSKIKICIEEMKYPKRNL